MAGSAVRPAMRGGMGARRAGAVLGAALAALIGFGGGQPPELRQQLFQMAREWMQAMMAEEEDASTITKRKPPPARTVSPHPAAPERREDA